jgi:hypothetical protein
MVRDGYNEDVRRSSQNGSVFKVWLNAVSFVLDVHGSESIVLSSHAEILLVSSLARFWGRRQTVRYIINQPSPATDLLSAVIDTCKICLLLFLSCVSTIEMTCSYARCL